MNDVSQSAASQHVQDLEKWLGTQLLDRATRPLAVTPGGTDYTLISVAMSCGARRNLRAR